MVQGRGGEGGGGGGRGSNWVTYTSLYGPAAYSRYFGACAGVPAT